VFYVIAWSECRNNGDYGHTAIMCLLACTAAHLAQDFHVELFPCAPCTILAKNMLGVSAVGADIMAHVLYDAHDWDVDLPEHVSSSASIYESNVLQLILKM
jgi:hypothetical protein